jgi:serine/threonine-protein kinase
MDVRPGVTLGDRYDLVRPLGSGAHGEVWEALDRHRNLNVALKLLIGEDPRGAWHEAAVLTALRSPHILEVHNADRFLDDVAYLDTALARTSLDKLCSPVAMSPQAAVDAIRRTLRGLELCHSVRLLHRDVKPANIFEDLKGDVVLGDFGAASLMDASGFATWQSDPRVRGPEYYQGTRYSVPSEIYAASVSLFFLLTGAWAFPQHTHEDLEEAVRTGASAQLRVLAPHVSEALARVVRKGMSLDPAKRFASAAEFDSALGRLPSRALHFAPCAPHRDHDRCWVVSGSRSLRVCLEPVGDIVAITVRQAGSGNRVKALCVDTRAGEAGVAVRKLFDDLRAGR